MCLFAYNVCSYHRPLYLLAQRPVADSIYIFSALLSIAVSLPSSKLDLIRMSLLLYVSAYLTDIVLNRLTSCSISASISASSSLNFAFARYAFLRICCSEVLDAMLVFLQSALWSMPSVSMKIQRRMPTKNSSNSCSLSKS